MPFPSTFAFSRQLFGFSPNLQLGHHPKPAPRKLWGSNSQAQMYSKVQPNGSRDGKDPKESSIYSHEIRCFGLLNNSLRISSCGYGFKRIGPPKVPIAICWNIGVYDRWTPLKKATNSVGGCEILHQTDVWNPSKIMGKHPMFGMAVARWPEGICQGFFSYWMNGNIFYGATHPKNEKKSHGCPWFLVSFSLPHPAKPIQWKAKTLWNIPYFSWLKHVKAYFFLG